MAKSASYSVLSVDGVGVNNLPAKATEALAELFGPISELIEDAAGGDALPEFRLAIDQAVTSGYANCFEAVPADVVWRAQLDGSDGRAHPRPTAMGAQSAIVVGPDGADTPAGAEDGPVAFGAARDHGVSGQGNLAGGNAPVWHGASSDDTGHRNAAAQWGVRSKEFGGAGYNQLLFDDTDTQGRVQLRTTLAATELNLGHLVHGSDFQIRGACR